MRRMIDRNDKPRDDESRGSFVGKNRACSVGEFFNGWQRKAGLALLVMALLVLSGWYRSHRFKDVISIYSDDNTVHWLVSSTDELRWIRLHSFHHAPIGTSRNCWRTYPVTPSPLNRFAGLHTHWHWGMVGFHFGEFDSGSPPIDRRGVWIVPYWALVLPLTLLSACLILVKPQKAKAATGGMS